MELTAYYVKNLPFPSGHLSSPTLLGTCTYETYGIATEMEHVASGGINFAQKRFCEFVSHESLMSKFLCFQHSKLHRGGTLGATLCTAKCPTENMAEEMFLELRTCRERMKKVRKIVEIRENFAISCLSYSNIANSTYVELFLDISEP